MGTLFADEERILQLIALNATAGCHVDYLASKLVCTANMVRQRVLQINRRLARREEAVVTIDGRYHRVSKFDAEVERTPELVA